MKRHFKEYNTSDIRLDRNECICPSFIRELFKNAKITERDYFKYKSSLETELSLGMRFNCANPTDNIYTDNGSEQILKNLINVINCKTWVIATPTFEMFQVYCSIFKKQVKTTPFKYVNERFTIDLLSRDCNSSGLYIVSPHNPTGYVLTAKEINNLSEIYKYIIIDQAYISPLEDLNFKDLPKNVILVRTFSKMGGLTGMRFGFCITHNRDIILKLNLLRPMYLNSLTIKLVDTILNAPNTLLSISQEFNKVKKMLDMRIISEAGNFILLEGIQEYKGYSLKKYVFNEREFYRMTLFDTETYYKL